MNFANINQQVKSIVTIVLASFIILGLETSCGKSLHEIMLLGFESDAELDLLKWNCHTLYSLSDLHATNGTHSLKLDIFPSDYPGLAFSPSVKDWSYYGTLSFDIYNPSEQTEVISIRIDDIKKKPPFADRYNGHLAINKGMNHIAIPLTKLQTSGTGRYLDLAHIYAVYFFVSNPTTKKSFYIDNIKISNNHS